MIDYLSEFANLLLRWLHVIAAIAWIGESIYFVMLDNSLKTPPAQARRKGVAGEMWAVHGGGFYHNQKYFTSPPGLPQELHWSFWKAYSTWLSGFALFSLLYLFKPDFYLVNRDSSWAWAASMTGGQASALAIAVLVLGWFVYDQLCRRISPNMQRDGALSIAVGIMVVLLGWLCTQVFQGRAAFLMTGAVMATCMSANVLFWIIPGQRRMVHALKSGTAPDPLDGKRGKQRSVHNTYFTLPVVFLMLSNHYSFAFSGPHAWAFMALFIVAGAAIRQYFVLRHQGQNQLAYPAAGIALLCLAGWIAAPASTAPDAASRQAAEVATSEAEAAPGAPSGKPAVSQDVEAIVSRRCVQCHAAAPSQAGFTAAPLGIRLDTPEAIVVHAAGIKQTVLSRYMPLGNMTKMTDEERAVIAGWSLEQ